MKFINTKKMCKSTATGWLRYLTVFVFTLSIGLVSYGQAPINDDPCAPTELTVGTTCVYTSGTTLNATITPGTPAPGCANFQGGDVWYSFVAPAGGSVIINTQAGGMTDGGMALFGGADCNTLTLIECDDDDGPGLMPMIVRSGLTPGNVYFIAVWEYGNDNPGTFDICISVPPPPPANDDCAGAISLTVNPDQNCAVITHGTTESATQTTGVPAPTCGAAGVNDDVWYSFVATGPVHVVSLLNVVGSVTDMAMSLYSGNCTALTHMICSDPNTMSIGGLTAGNTYYIRVWTYTSTAGASASFDICVGTPPPPPANDDCAGAVTLTVNPDLNCGVVTAGSTISATQSTGVPAPSCAATGVNDDVWFQFVATSQQHVISLLNVTGVTTDMAMSVYGGASCGSLTHLMCSDPNTMTVGGLTIGQTYYVRVWTYTSTSTSTASFNICVGTPPPPPANDNPCTATALEVQATCTMQTFTTASATGTTGVPAPGCANYQGGDVWFSVVVPAGGTLVFDTQSGVMTDGGMAIYSGADCNNLSLIECDDDDGAGLMLKIVRTGLTPPSPIWIRVWEYGNDNQGTFGLCVTLPPPAPANDEPCNATLLAASYGSCNNQTFTVAGALPSAGIPAPGCAGSVFKDVWFKAVVPCEGNLSITTSAGQITDGGMAIYSGTCGNLSLIECDDDDGPGAMPAITRSNLTPGDTIWIRFWDYGGNDDGTFQICVEVKMPPIILPAQPASPTCTVAQPFCTSTVPYVLPNVSGQTPTQAPGGGIYGCLYLIPNPTYYQLQIQNSGSIELTISQQNNSGSGVDVDFVIWGPFSTPLACSQISAANIVDCSYSADPVEVINIPNAVAGEYYVLLVTNWGNQAGTITYQQTGGTGSSSCCTLDAANSAPVVCPGGTINFTSSPVANATYSWVGPNCFSSTLQNPNGAIAPSTPGQYVYTVTAYTPTGQVCSDTTMVTVVAPPDFGADSSVTICQGSTFDLTTLYTTTGLTSNWTFGGSNVNNPAAVSAAGTYQLVGINAAGCSDTVLVNISIDQVAATAQTIQGNCTTTGTITVNTTSGISPYLYAISSAPGEYQPENVFTPIPGNYTISVKDSLGCLFSLPVTLSYTNNLVLDVMPDTIVCKGAAPVQIRTNSNATGFSWTPAAGLSDANIANPVYTPGDLGTYKYVVTGTLGVCSLQDSISFTVFTGVTVNAGPDITLVNQETVQIHGTAVNAASVLWTPATSLSSATVLNPNVRGDNIGTFVYTLTGTSPEGCTASDEMTVTVIPYCVKVKNAFTPNGDGKNDYWQVYDNIECIKNVKVHVYNRYGGKVFESRDYRNDWNGTYKGKPVPDGTYYGVVEFSLINGRVFTVKTDLTILR